VGCSSIVGFIEDWQCEHHWLAEDCTKLAFCEYCGKETTDLVNESHEWMEPTCGQAARCKYCDVTTGEPTNDHVWGYLYCGLVKTCKVCSATEGGVIEHDWQEATCAKVKTCARCGATDGWEKPPHEYLSATCTVGELCANCGYEKPDSMLAHDYVSYHCALCGCVPASTAEELNRYLDQNYNEIPTAVGMLKNIGFDVVEHDGNLLDEYWIEIRILQYPRLFYVEEHGVSLDRLITANVLPFEDRVQAFVDLLNFEMDIVSLVDACFPNIRVELSFFMSGYEQHWWGEEYWSHSYLEINRRPDGECYLSEPDVFIGYKHNDEDINEIFRAVTNKFTYPCELKFTYFTDRFIEQETSQ
jgi:hypothetical protein